MNPCIVLVEASTIVRRAVEIALAQLGHAVIAVDDANAALEVIESRPTLLVIAASKLPGVDGYSLAHRLGEDPSTGHLPVILLLSRGESFQPSKTGTQLIFEAVEKPFLSQVLVKSVCAALGVSVPNEELYRPYLVDIPLAHPIHALDSSSSSAPDLGPDNATRQLESSVPDLEGSAEIEDVESVDSFLSSGLLSSDVSDDQAPLKGADDLEDEDLVQDSVPDSMGDSMDQDDPTESVVDILQTVDAKPILENVNSSPLESDSVPGRRVPPQPETIRFDDEEPPKTADDLGMDDAPSLVITQSAVIEMSTDSSGDAATGAFPTKTSPQEKEQSNAGLVDSVMSTAVDHLVKEEHAAISTVSKEVIESIAWEVIPPLAEAILREEIARLLREGRDSKG